jgi:hypothetical protein
VPRAPRIQSPADAIKQAAKAAPVGRYVQVALGVVAVVGTASLWGISHQVAIVGTSLVVVLMVVLAIVTRILTLPAKSTRGVAQFLQWSSAIIFVLIPLTLYSSVFFRVPQDLAFFLDPSLRRRALAEAELYVPYPPLHYDDQGAFVSDLRTKLKDGSLPEFNESCKQHNINGKGWVGTFVDSIREDGAEGIEITFDQPAPLKGPKPPTVRADCFIQPTEKLADLGMLKKGVSRVVLAKAWLEEISQNGKIVPAAKVRFSHCDIRVVSSGNNETAATH